MNTQTSWWKEAVVYQIYPRSFKDSNEDGIGDLRGIISRLNYVKSLGVDVIWLNPIYASPNNDNGYDISDYRAIMQEFGTMDDFDELLQAVHARGLRLVLDLVVNHTSDEHPWFQEARKARVNPYYNYYHWWPLEKEQPYYRPSYFEESAWQYNGRTQAWYLHYFSHKQPDLNWENPQVRQEVYSIMRFWLDKGIDGFRMDSIPLIAKDPTFPPIDTKKYPDLFSSYAHGPHLHDYLQEMHREVLSHYNVMTVGEGSALTYKDIARFVEPERKELNMVYGFGPSEVRNYSRPDIAGSGVPYSLIQLKEMFTDWDKAVGDGWPAIYLGNHDQPRMISRFGDDSPEYRNISAKMLATFLLTMRGTPFWYAGDEIGMVNAKFKRIEDYRDIATLNMYKELKKQKGDMQAFLKAQQQTSRDNARTPMQWDDSLHAGFTAGEPWIKANPDYVQVNVAAQEKDPDSVLNYFRKLIAIRRITPALLHGGYRLVESQHPQLYTYYREMEEQQFLIALNFSSKLACSAIPFSVDEAKLVLSNYGDHPQLSRPLTLRPYEAMIIEMNE